jgi:hypothetical protein
MYSNRVSRDLKSGSHRAPLQRALISRFQRLNDSLDDVLTEFHHKVAKEYSQREFENQEFLETWLVTLENLPRAYRVSIFEVTDGYVRQIFADNPYFIQKTLSIFVSHQDMYRSLIDVDMEIDKVSIVKPVVEEVEDEFIPLVLEDIEVLEDLEVYLNSLKVTELRILANSLNVDLTAISRKQEIINTIQAHVEKLSTQKDIIEHFEDEEN